MVHSMPAAEIEITETLVRSLLLEQAPELADRPLHTFARGWDNTIFALGDDHLVRLPHRQLAIDNVRNEQRWLPTLAQRLPIPIPVPVVAGVSNADFPWPWSIVERVDGVDAISTPPEPAAAVRLLAQFFSAMHVAAPDDAPFNAFGRGGPLAGRDEVTRNRFISVRPWLDERLDVGRLAQWWERAIEADGYDGPPRWVHGDMHPGNVVVRDGAIVSIIDFGDLTSGDPATDLGSAWMFFDSPERRELRQLLAVDDAMWERARGWAISVGLAIAENSADNPRYEFLSEQILRSVAADPG